MSKNLLLLISFLLALVQPWNDLRGQSIVRSEYGNGGMVVSDSSHASRIGRDVIAGGGNAVDSAVATAFALAVTWPEAGNIGGGGFMLIRPADGTKPVCIDYRETAPMESREDMFQLGENRYTRKLVGVPGTVRGLALAHERYGRLAWKDLVMPAARLATTGFTVDASLAKSTNRILEATRNDSGSTYSELHRVYGKPDGTPWKTGDVMKLPDLGRTLSLIAEKGPDAFYRGPLANFLLDEMKKTGGLIRKVDLEKYRAIAREPITGTFGQYTIIGAPPPSSGGIAIVQGLNMVEAMDLPREKHTPRTLHLLAEVSRRFFLDRARYLGDPNFAEIPDHLTSKPYARELVAKIDPDHATDSASLAPDIKLASESDDTTHFSIVDGEGMAVANTYTLEASWGSRIVVPGAGYVLNNEMGDFNWVKGYTDRVGRIGTKNNLIQPGKRMLSSQCPLIVTKNDRVFLVTGSPGGRTIINTVFNLVLNFIHFDMTVPQAVQSRRFHHQWMPDVLSLEASDREPFRDLRAELEALGHRTVNRPFQGSAHTLGYDSTTKMIVGVADFRRGGRPAGISSNRRARWDFGGKTGSSLDQQVATGSDKTRWSTAIAGCWSDGEDQLTIRREASDVPDASDARITDITDSCQLSIEFSELKFAGTARNEELRFSLIQDENETTSTVAAMTIGRNSENQIVLSGSAFGTEATSIGSVVLAETPQMGEATAVRLSVDLKQADYRIGVRHPMTTVFEIIGRGTLDSNQSVNGIRMQAVNSFAEPDEAVRIESIELSATPQR